MITRSSLPLRLGASDAIEAAGLVASLGLLWSVIENTASIADVSLEEVGWTRQGTHRSRALAFRGRLVDQTATSPDLHASKSLPAGQGFLSRTIPAVPPNALGHPRSIASMMARTWSGISVPYRRSFPI